MRIDDDRLAVFPPSGKDAVALSPPSFPSAMIEALKMKL